MKKMLVIEDNTTTLDIFLKSLATEGFYAIGAKNGLIGIQQAQEQLPDLVICDVMMPELDGYGVLTTLRQDPVTAIIPFIFVTARVTKAELRQGMELGADDYLTKPCTLDELLRAIAARLEKQVPLQQWYAAQSQRVIEPLPPDTIRLAAATQSIFPSCPKLTEVFHFIEANYHRPITLGEVAEIVGYSPTYLTNLMGLQTGQTVHCWIVKRRMAQACSLLLETKLTVNQIAEAVGYQDASYFGRQFRQLHGMPPKAWRKKGDVLPS